MDNNSKYKFKIDDARDTLERIHNLTNNCDTKTSIILGIIGVIGGICLSDSIVITIYHYLKNHFSTIKCKVFFAITCIIIAGIVFGIFKLISVLYARVINDCNRSNIFFGDIAKYSSENEYKKSLLNMSETDIINDYINQIYINSKICDTKYKRYNQGVITVGISLALFAIDIIVFLILR